MTKKTILVFNGGGLAPALNPTLYGVITKAKKQGFRILGGMYGWASLLDNGRVIDLTKLNIEPIKNIGGTFLRSSRTNPFNVKDGITQLKDKIKEHKIDYLVAIGGNDTMGAAEKLFREHNLPIIGIPKTIDNDLPETYFTPGFPSAAFYFSSYVKEIREDAAYALSRIYIIEAMGQDAGWLVAAGVYGGADIIVPPEKKIKVEKILDIVEKKYAENGYFAVIALSEQAKFDQPIEGIAQDQKDSFNVSRKSFTSLPLRNLIKEKLGIDCKALVPGNYWESGQPIEIDKIFAIKLGQKSIDLIKKERFGEMTCLKKKGKKIVVDSVALKKVFAKEKIKKLGADMFDFDNLKPKKKFLNYLESILGKPKNQNNGYYQLIKKINR